MKIQIQKNVLQQARKQVDIPLSTMAEILMTDVSNLSKYERGIHVPNSYISTAYHLMTGVSFVDIFRQRLYRCIEFLQTQISERTVKLREELQHAMDKGLKTIKIETLIKRLEERLEHLSCLQETDLDNNNE